MEALCATLPRAPIAQVGHIHRGQCSRVPKTVCLQRSKKQAVCQASEAKARHTNTNLNETVSASRCEESSLSEFQVPLASASCMYFLLAEAANAADSGLSYDPTGGEEFFKNVAGAAYIVLVAFFLYRVLGRRAKRAKEQKIAGPQPGDVDAAPSVYDQIRQMLGGEQPVVKKATAWDAFLGAAQAGLLAGALYMAASHLQAVISIQELPDQYTARNISITVRTIFLGLGWLGTFMFGVNALGLFGLSVQMLVAPGSLKDDEFDAAARKAAGPQLPKVGVTSKPGEVRRAFEMAERMGRTSSSLDSSEDAGAATPGSQQEASKDTTAV